MRLKRWALIKITLISFLSVGIVTDPTESADNAWRIAAFIVLASACFALFQVAVWLFYDLITFKRGGWVAPHFGDSPFAKDSGPGLYLKVPAVALLIFGSVKIVAAIFQGVPSLVLGAALLAAGAFLLVWQALLRKLFQSRFADQRHQA